MNKGFQGKFIAWSIAVSSLGGIVAALSFAFLADRKIEELLYSMWVPPHIFSGTFLLREALLANGIAAMIVAIIFIAAVGIVFHKIAGPLHVIRNGVLRMGSGNLTSGIALRKNDDFQDLACAVNHLNAELDRKLSAINDRAKQIEEIAEELRTSGNPDSDITALVQEIDGLEKDIGEFRK